MKHLSRADFEKQVFARHKGCCAFCSLKAVDAHHIFERKLFAMQEEPNAGYFLANGVAVCEGHHWDCETTVLSIEQVLKACNIEKPCLPSGLAPGKRYDKRGNVLRSDGLREPGPLFEDMGCRRALKAGGFLGLFVPAGTPE